MLHANHLCHVEMMHEFLDLELCEVVGEVRVTCELLCRVMTIWE